MNHFLVIYSGPEDETEIELVTAIGTNGSQVRELFLRTWFIRTNLSIYRLREALVSKLAPERQDQDKLLIAAVSPSPPHMAWYGRMEDGVRTILDSINFAPPSLDGW